METLWIFAALIKILLIVILTWFTYNNYQAFININEQSLQTINESQTWFWIAFALGLVLLIIYFCFDNYCFKTFWFCLMIMVVVNWLILTILSGIAINININNQMIEQNQLLIKILISCALMTLGFFISVIKDLVVRNTIRLKNGLEFEIRRSKS